MFFFQADLKELENAKKLEFKIFLLSKFNYPRTMNSNYPVLFISFSFFYKSVDSIEEGQNLLSRILLIFGRYYTS